MAFKSEIHVAELASIRTGHTEGDIYYILDNGMLGDLPCKPGTFVKWHNDAWQIQPDEHYALASAVDGEIVQAIDNLLDDGSTSETVVVAVPSSQSNDYIVGNYYEVQGKVAKLRTKTDGDNVTQLTFDTTSGLLEAINNNGKLVVFTYTAASKPLLSDLQDARDDGKAVFLVCGEDVHAGSYWLEKGTVLSLVFDTSRPGYGTHSMEFMCTGAFKGSDCVTVRCVVNGNNTWEWHACDTGAVKNGGALTDAASVNVPNNAFSTLSTVQAALTLNVNVNANEVPNFAVEVTPSVDVTLTVTKTVGNTTTTLNPSAAGGDSLTTGKLYQLTCVGSCWTLAEFTVPTP